MRPVRYVATGADVTAGFTPPIPVDYHVVDPAFSLQYLASGGGAGTGTTQVTIDDPFNPPAAGLTWATVTLTTGRGSYIQPARAFRILTPVAGDVLTVVQQGGP